MADDTGTDKKDLTRLDTFTGGTGGPPSHTETDDLAGPDLGALLGLEAARPTGSEGEPSIAASGESELSIPEPATSTAAPIAEPDLGVAPETAFEPIPPMPQAPEPQAMEQVRVFSEQMSVGKAHVPASFPFSLMLEGHLLPEEKEKLLDILSRENLEIREVDLEPQFAEGRILIPRVSEYVCVLIAQALRSSTAKIRLGPSDDIYSTEDTRTRPDEFMAPTGSPTSSSHHDSFHPAERLPVTSEASLPELGAVIVVDVVAASAGLSVHAVEAERSTEYQELVDALQKELKFKAWRKGASGILNFAIRLERLSLPSRYRVLVTGSAVRSSRPATGS
jgi:hypothetical protein